MGPFFDFELLIPITAIICTFIFLMRVTHLKHMNARYKHEAKHSGEIAALRAQVQAYDRNMEQLEERIRVLERIVTDEPTTLRREIERLRA